jgi:hypothetical protein
MGGKEDITFDDLLKAAKLYQQGPYRITIEEGKLTIEKDSTEDEPVAQTFTFEQTKLAIIAVETQNEETGEVVRIPDWFVARMFLATELKNPEEWLELLGAMKKHRPELYQTFEKELEEFSGKAGSTKN